MKFQSNHISFFLIICISVFYTKVLYCFSEDREYANDLFSVDNQLCILEQLSLWGGGAYCKGDSGVHLGSDSSQVGVQYILFFSGNPLDTFTGTGFRLDFGLYKDSGYYCVKSIDTTALCDLWLKDTLWIYYHPPPEANFTVNTDEQCLNTNSFAFSNHSTITSGTLRSLWDFGDSTFSIVHDPAHQYQKDGYFIVKLITESDQGCHDSMIRQIRVLPSPQLDFLINDTGQCLKQNLFILTNTSVISSGTMSFFWEVDDGTVTTDTNLIHVFVSTGDYQVTLFASSGLGCTASKSRNLHVYPHPVADFSVNDSAQCLIGNSFAFSNHSSIASNILSYFWTFGDGTLGEASKDPIYSYLTTGKHRVTLVAFSQYSCTDTQQKEVLVFPHPPKVRIESIGDTVFCEGDSTLLKAPANYVAYLWINGSRNQSIIARSSGYYTVQVSDSHACSTTSFPKTVIAHPNPLPDLGNDTAFCTGESLLLDAGEGYSAYNWNSGLSDSRFLQVDKQGVYQVRVIDPHGCAGEDMIEIGVYPKPELSAWASEHIIYRGDCSRLAVSGANSYFWFPSNGLDDPNSPSPLACPDTTTRYYVVGYDINGCSNFDTLVIFVIPIDNPYGLIFYNSFSPNGDGKNDTWVIYNIEKHPANHLRIFNRWGDLVYEKEGYNNDWNGSSLALGTYFYILELKEKSAVFRGDVNIIR
jgi:gliding motility-associated-like protein